MFNIQCYPCFYPGHPSFSSWLGHLGFSSFLSVAVINTLPKATPRQGLTDLQLRFIVHHWEERGAGTVSPLSTLTVAGLNKPRGWWLPRQVFSHHYIKKIPCRHAQRPSWSTVFPRMGGSRLCQADNERRHTGFCFWELLPLPQLQPVLSYWCAVQ